MKKYISLLLALLLMVGLLAGCGNTEEKPSTAPSTDPTTEPTQAPNNGDDPTTEPVDEVKLPLTEDDVTFDYWLPNSMTFEGYSGSEDSEFYKWMEKQTGVHINFINPPSSGVTESFQTMVLSEDYPDFIYRVFSFYSGGVDKAISDRFLLRLNEPAEQYMPHYMAVVNRDEDTFIQSVSDSGNLWGVHCILDRQQGSWIGTGIREDWLTDAGMTVKDVETIDGLERALTAFKDYTHENQGPLFLSMGSATYSGSITGSWNVMGVTQMPFLSVDGKAIYNGMNEGYKAYVGKMADWYSKGLVNKNYVAENHWAAPDDYWINGNIGCADVMYASISMLTKMNASSDFGADPDYTITAIPTPKLNASDDIWNDYHCRESFNVVRATNSVGISTQCSNIELACKWWDYIFTEEGTTASNWGPYVGELGDTNSSYYIDETDANGDGHVEVYQPWMMEKYGNCVYFMGLYTIHNGPQIYIWDREFTALSQKEVDSARIWDSVGTGWLWPDGVTLTADEGTEASGIVAACNTAVNEWAVKVITGEKKVDTYETELVPQLKTIGIERATELYQNALSRYYDRAKFMD